MVILRDVFVANIPVSHNFKEILCFLFFIFLYSSCIVCIILYMQVRENNFRLKCMYVAVMLRRMMEAIINKDAMDDKVISRNLISIFFHLTWVGDDIGKLSTLNYAVKCQVEFLNINIWLYAVWEDLIVRDH